jgi:ATP-dependent helicase/nuclease subunit B
LLKIETILKLNNWQSWLKNGEEYLQLLEAKFCDNLPNNQRANPQPFLWEKNNLTKISATDVSKWLRNPYFIYAKRILQLKPLKNIEQTASFAEFGNFVHKVLENFVKNYSQIAAEKRLEILINDYGKILFKQYFPDQTSTLLWWAKFENIAQWFVKQEDILQENLAATFVEIEAEAIIGNIILSTKIDRLNLFVDGSYEIIDYKTGQLPSAKNIKSGLEPQLAIEALIICLGKIKNYPNLNNAISKKAITNFQYQNLKGRDSNKIMNISKTTELINAAEDGISRLLTMFVDQNLGYVCCPNFDLYKKDDYWHLGRVGEL